MPTFTGNTVASNAVIYASDHNTLKSLLEALLNGNLDATNLANNAVTTVKITDDSVTEAKVADGFLHGSDGYIDATETWTYASATSFTVAGDVSAKFPVGTKIRLTQTTDKYFYVTATSVATDTTVTITGGTDYTLANAAISSPRYSYLATPQGFPAYFNYAAAWTTDGTQPALGNGSVTSKFTMYGKKVDVQIQFIAGSTTTYGTGTYRWSLPVTAPTYSISFMPFGVWQARDMSANAQYGGFVPYYDTTKIYWGLSHSITTTGSMQNVVQATAPFTWANTDQYGCTFTYEAA